MKLFDLHCDTATKLLKNKQELLSNDLHISLSKADAFESYAQIMAVWSDNSLSDCAAWTKFFEVVKNLENEIKKNSSKVSLITKSKRIEPLWESGQIPLILSVEDARILENDLLRLDVLKDCGVRALTLNWSGNTNIGGGHDTQNGLTEFGKSVVKKCFEIGIIPDVSHSSLKGTRECIEIACETGKPIIASHSNSYSVMPHSRNLRDEDFEGIRVLGGIVGISLCPYHLAKDDADISDVIKHIEHYLSLGGEDTLCLGCDLDGTDLPNGFDGISDLPKIANELARLNYSQKQIEKIFYANALNFIKKNI